MADVLIIDGSQGEGGGQILRTALSLSIVATRAFRLVNIRAGRRNPGLLPQHLSAVRAAAAISGAVVSGDQLGSTELIFAPMQIARKECTVGDALTSTASEPAPVIQVTRIISGGQTGADQGALAAAKRLGLPTGGWMPRGFLTESGPRPDFAMLYGMREHPEADYTPRTEANVRDADGTLIIGDASSGGSRDTKEFCGKHHKPCYVLPWRSGQPVPLDSVSEFRRWLAEHHIRVLNVAGNRDFGFGKGDWTFENFRNWVRNRPGFLCGPAPGGHKSGSFLRSHELAKSSPSQKTNLCGVSNKLWVL